MVEKTVRLDVLYGVQPYFVGDEERVLSDRAEIRTEEKDGFIKAYISNERVFVFENPKQLTLLEKIKSWIKGVIHG